MKRLTVFTVILVMVACLVGTMALANDVEVTDIKTKIIGKKDSSGDIYFAIKAKVRNLGNDKDVSVSLQGIDREGFELKDLTLSGKIAPGQSKVLTDKRNMSYKLFKRIVKWQVD